MQFKPKNIKTNKKLTAELLRCASKRSYSHNALRNVLARQQYSLKNFIGAPYGGGDSFPLNPAVYKKVGTALAATVLMLYVANINTDLSKIKSEAENLSAQNSSLSGIVSDTRQELDNIDKLYNDTVTELQNTQEKLENSEADSAEKQEIIDSMEAVEEEKREGLENAIKDLIETFGDQNVSRSGGELYSSLEKIDTAKGIIAAHLSDNPNSAAYIEALNSEKVKLEDRLKRYPDYEPAQGMLTSYFGSRGNSYHNGIDIANSYGTPIYAAAYGVVSETITVDRGGLGIHLKIDHGNGFVTVYGHMSKIIVSEGQIVEKGQLIGYVGTSGVATGPHVHIEVILNGTRQNPLNYLYPELQ